MTELGHRNQPLTAKFYSFTHDNILLYPVGLEPEILDDTRSVI